MNIKKISALSLALVFSISIKTKGATSLPPIEKSDKESKRIELRKNFSVKKHNSGLYRTAKEIGITKEELKEAREKEGNFFELAKKKGYTEQQVKDMIIKNKNQSIDKAAENGKITEEKAKELKEKAKAKVSKWDGKLKSFKDRKNENSKS